MTSLMDTFEFSCEESAGLRVAVFLDELGNKILEAWEILSWREVMEVFLEASKSSTDRVFWVERRELCPGKLERVVRIDWTRGRQAFFTCDDRILSKEDSFPM